MTHSAPVELYMTDNYGGTAEAIAGGETAEILKNVFISGNGHIPMHWTHVGSGRIIFEIKPREELTASLIESLQEQLRKSRVKAAEEETRLMERIQNLLALPAPTEGETV